MMLSMLEGTIPGQKSIQTTALDEEIASLFDYYLIALSYCWDNGVDF
jgi:hypothetical protein